VLVVLLGEMLDFKEAFLLLTAYWHTAVVEVLQIIRVHKLALRKAALAVAVTTTSQLAV
jgi:hypothetical protein